MIPQDIEDLIRSGGAPIDLSERRVDHVIDGVLSRLGPQAPARWWQMRREPGWDGRLAPVFLGRFAAVMAVAALLGIAVGTSLDDPQVATPLTTLFSTNTLFPMGS